MSGICWFAQMLYNASLADAIDSGGTSNCWQAGGAVDIWVVMVMTRKVVFVRLSPSTAEYSVKASGICGSGIVSAFSRIMRISVDERNEPRADRS